MHGVTSIADSMRNSHFHLTSGQNIFLKHIPWNLGKIKLNVVSDVNFQMIIVTFSLSLQVGYKYQEFFFGPTSKKFIFSIFDIFKKAKNQFLHEKKVQKFVFCHFQTIKNSNFAHNSIDENELL